MRLIAITGQIRSGTSLMAELVHFLGFPVTVAMHAPSHPTWRCEWEDPDLAYQLAYGTSDVDFKSHLLMRRDSALRQAKYFNRNLPGISIKSPFLAMEAEALEEACCDDQLGFELEWLVIGRQPDAIEASLQASLKGKDLANARYINEMIPKEVKPEFWYEDFIRDPYPTVSRLAKYLGVKDMDSILRAVGRVQTKEVV